jgi:hypothetical protein
VVGGGLAGHELLSSQRFGSANGRDTFLPLTPSRATDLSTEETLDILSQRLGKDKLERILQGENVPSPVQGEPSSDWMKQAKIIGVPMRTMRHYWNLVKYAVSCPEDAIQLLPLLEPGAEGSVYAPASWMLSKEYMSNRLSKYGFDTPEKQLKLVVNILHGLGKTVVFDATPHMDRFAETVFTNPDLFEWVQLSPIRTKQMFYPDVDPDNIHRMVQRVVQEYVRKYGAANGARIPEEQIRGFYSKQLSEEERRQILFGDDDETRLKRRLSLMQAVRAQGLETISQAAEPPYRPVMFSRMSSVGTQSRAEFTLPGLKDGQEEAVVGQNDTLNSVTPFKLYHLTPLGRPDIERPNTAGWNFLKDKWRDFQKTYGFDFFGASQAHIQLSKANPAQRHLKDIPEFYRDLKQYLQDQSGPHIASFAESYLQQGIIEPEADMGNKDFDAVLGSLWQQPLGPEYRGTLRRYATLKNHQFKPAISNMTVESDAPAYNHVYADPVANRVKTFLAYFLNLPSYHTVGFEVRDLNPKDYASNALKTLKKPFEWGKNQEFFEALTAIRQQFVSIRSRMRQLSFQWLGVSDLEVLAFGYKQPPNANGEADQKLNSHLSGQGAPEFLFVANTNTQATKPRTLVDTDQQTNGQSVYEETFTTAQHWLPADRAKRVTFHGKQFIVNRLLPGECRIYRKIDPGA